MAARPHLPSAVSPFDAAAAVQHLLEHLRAAAGATRVSVWVHEPAGSAVVPYRVAARPGDDGGAACLQRSIPLSGYPFLATAIRSRRPVIARADGSRATDRDLSQRGISSAHAQPLIQDDAVVGVLTVEPAAAASPALLRQLTPLLTRALSAAWNHRSEQRRTAQSEVLLAVIESAAAATTIEELLALACRQLTALEDVAGAAIFLAVQDRLAPDPPPEVLSLVEKVLRTGHPVVTGRGSVTGLPLGRSPHVVGVLVVDGGREPALPGDVRRLVAAAALHIGAVIELLRARQARAMHRLLGEDPRSGVRQDRARAPRRIRTAAERS